MIGYRLESDVDSGRLRFFPCAREKAFRAIGGRKDRGGHVLEELHLIRVRYLGWGLLLAWVFCTFYTDVALNAMGSLAPAVLAESNRGSALSVLPVLSAIAALAALVFVERRLGAVVDHPAVLWVSAAMACASTGPSRFPGSARTMSSW